MVQLHPGPPRWFGSIRRDFGFENISNSEIRNPKSAVDPGGVAQLGERLPCTQEVIGSNPFTSTTRHLVDLGGGNEFTEKIIPSANSKIIKLGADTPNAFLNCTFTTQFKPSDVILVENILGII